MQKVKLIIGLIYSKDKKATAIKKLEELYGPTDAISENVKFDFTDYYASEMGRELGRIWLGFRNLIEQDALADIKNKTIEIEKDFSISGKRTINIDPGYLAPSKLILASTKDNIYAEITLQFSKNAFRFLPWTYPDYQSEKFIQFLSDCREKLLVQLKAL